MKQFVEDYAEGLLMFRQPFEKPKYAQDTMMAGKCLTCGNVVECRYADCEPPRPERSWEKEFGFWQDCPSAECPACKATSKSDPQVGARVVMMDKVAFAKAHPEIPA